MRSLTGSFTRFVAKGESSPAPESITSARSGQAPSFREQRYHRPCGTPSESTVSGPRSVCVRRRSACWDPDSEQSVSVPSSESALLPTATRLPHGGAAAGGNVILPTRPTHPERARGGLARSAARRDCASIAFYAVSRMDPTARGLRPVASSVSEACSMATSSCPGGHPRHAGGHSHNCALDAVAPMHRTSTAARQHASIGRTTGALPGIG